MNIEHTSQPEEEPSSRIQIQPWNPTTPLKTSSYKISIHSPLNDPFQGYHSSSLHSRPTIFSSNSGSQDSSSNPSFDIYGNEISQSHREEFSELERIIEEGPPEGVIKFDKENNDPVTNIITPLKRRSETIRNSSSRGSFGINRSPLLDITPSVPKRKPEVQEFKIEVRLP